MLRDRMHALSLILTFLVTVSCTPKPAMQAAQEAQAQPDAEEGSQRLDRDRSRVQAGRRFMPQLFGWMVHVYPSRRRRRTSGRTRNALAFRSFEMMGAFLLKRWRTPKDVA
jgi:hypothetical protein